MVFIAAMDCQPIDTTVKKKPEQTSNSSSSHILHWNCTNADHLSSVCIYTCKSKQKQWFTWYDVQLSDATLGATKCQLVDNNTRSSWNVTSAPVCIREFACTISLNCEATTLTRCLKFVFILSSELHSYLYFMLCFCSEK